MGHETICTQCVSLHGGRTKLSFLGNPTFTCRACGQKVMLPMSKGRATFYLVLLGLMLMGTIYYLAHGILAPPGLIGILVIYALGRDVRLRRELGAARERAALPPHA